MAYLQGIQCFIFTVCAIKAVNGLHAVYSVAKMSIYLAELNTTCCVTLGNVVFCHEYVFIFCIQDVDGGLVPVSKECIKLHSCSSDIYCSSQYVIPPHTRPVVCRPVIIQRLDGIGD